MIVNILIQRRGLFVKKDFLSEKKEFSSMVILTGALASTIVTEVVSRFGGF